MYLAFECRAVNHVLRPLSGEDIRGNCRATDFAVIGTGGGAHIIPAPAHGSSLLV